MEALAVAAAESGWPAFLLEKDIWVILRFLAPPGLPATP
jgi:hypothetical protein